MIKVQIKTYKHREDVNSFENKEMLTSTIIITAIPRKLNSRTYAE